MYTYTSIVHVYVNCKIRIKSYKFVRTLFFRRKAFVKVRAKSHKNMKPDLLIKFDLLIGKQTKSDSTKSKNVRWRERPVALFSTRSPPQNMVTVKLYFQFLALMHVPSLQSLPAWAFHSLLGLSLKLQRCRWLAADASLYRRQQNSGLLPLLSWFYHLLFLSSICRFYCFLLIFE